MEVLGLVQGNHGLLSDSTQASIDSNGNLFPAVEG